MPNQPQNPQNPQQKAAQQQQPLDPNSGSLSQQRHQVMQAMQGADGGESLPQHLHQKMQGLPNINWSSLWGLIQKYGPLVRDALLVILPVLQPGVGWMEIEQAINTYIQSRQP